MREHQKVQKMAHKENENAKYKKLQRASKNLIAVFDSLAEDLSFETPKQSHNFSPISKLNQTPDPNNQESVNFSPVSAISELNQTGDLSSQSFMQTPDSAHSTISLDSFFFTESPEEVFTTENHELGLEPLTPSQFNGDSKLSSPEAEMIVSLLRKAIAQVLSSSEKNSQSKKLLHELVEMVIQTLQTVPKEKDPFEYEPFSAKTRIMLVCFLLFILAMAAASLFFGSEARGSFGKPPPT